MNALLSRFPCFLLSINHSNQRIYLHTQFTISVKALTLSHHTHQSQIIRTGSHQLQSHQHKHHSSLLPTRHSPSSPHPDTLPIDFIRTFPHQSHHNGSQHHRKGGRPALGLRNLRHRSRPALHLIRRQIIQAPQRRARASLGWTPKRRVSP